MPYYEDYPMNDSHWNVFEQFPNNFDDVDHDAEKIQKHNNIN
eukprot:CAMPEP_0117002216 /NCGR_PEP_ID=MMETSP0472-20121206/3968_1 /TAXON_ID=693140 ORGANISM="Tiarina fusus, Strain LIS" /NCGR_SAMPLE_ID=MMETSP0472 /ASSEMBLY_ACC=CAM_ASM_000603 /LENGTH=41 /DNA_ID= /DNA_START= /DNA_END= /DNA_ORIENTATION=